MQDPKEIQILGDSYLQHLESLKLQVNETVSSCFDKVAIIDDTEMGLLTLTIDDASDDIISHFEKILKQIVQENSLPFRVKSINFHNFISPVKNIEIKYPNEENPLHRVHIHYRKNFKDLPSLKDLFKKIQS